VQFPANRRILLAAGIGVALIAGAAWFWRTRTATPVAELLRRLPREDRVIASIDVSTLRRAGLLKTLTGAQPEADYQQFVAATGFDYLRDLETLLIAYGKSEALLFVRGRFDLTRLRRYAETSGGSCSGSLCRVKGTTPGVTIGFASIDSSTLAVASSTDPDAINVLLSPQPGPLPIEPQPQPIWFLLPPALLKDGILPPRMTMFATAALECEHVYVAIGAREAGGGGDGFQARLKATCQSAEQAQQAVRELQAATTMIRRVLAREQKQPDPADLTGILTKGEFQANENRISGSWPIDKAFVESLGK
jgi:hypothetical protein